MSLSYMPFTDIFHGNGCNRYSSIWQRIARIFNLLFSGISVARSIVLSVVCCRSLFGLSRLVIVLSVHLRLVIVLSVHLRLVIVLSVHLRLTDNTMTKRRWTDNTMTKRRWTDNTMTKRSLVIVLSVHLRLVIVLSVLLRYTDPDYPFSIF
jgi:hypothetical protein